MTVRCRCAEVQVGEVHVIDSGVGKPYIEGALFHGAHYAAAHGDLLLEFGTGHPDLLELRIRKLVERAA
jgi:hypothetical protein